MVPGDALTADAGGEDALRRDDGRGTRCTLTFDLGAAEGSSRVLLYRRGDEQARWELTTG